MEREVGGTGREVGGMEREARGTEREMGGKERGGREGEEGKRDILWAELKVFDPISNEHGFFIVL